MKRLTVFEGGFWLHKGFPPVEADRVDEFIDCVKELAARLAAYEDTGLDPEEIEQLKRERDAAIEDIFNFSSNKCFCCAHNTHKWLSDGGMDDLCKTCLENGKCKWEWRGVRKER